jgi:thiosulfate/3-mercaptopyruvate sulfurtransferase
VVHTTLVSTNQLAGHLGEWAIVDCRFDLHKPEEGRNQYRAAHVPGAVYASLNDDLAGPRTGRNGRHPLPSIDALTAVFGRMGIAPGVQVVAYDQDAGMYASRLWWSLRYLGHDRVAVLDGGWAKWMSEGRPVTGGDERRPTVEFTPAPRRDAVVDIDEVSARQRDGVTLLVDARAPERFEGRSEPLDRVAGHIPGAVNHFYRWNLAADGTMLPPEALRDRFTRLLAGRAPEQTVMYCGSGVTACHNLLAMAHAGLAGSPLYPGSWSEWSSDPSRPVE